MAAYIISDGRGKYIRRDFAGKYSPVRSEALADVWDEKVKAQNVLRNQINRNIRNRYKVVEIDIQPIPKEVAVTKGVDLKKDIVPKSEIKEWETQIDKWGNEISLLSGFITDMENRREILTKALSDVDKEIIDIEHYIELGTFNAYQGWLAFSMLRHRLKKRRKVKDELQVISQINNCKINSTTVSNIKNTIHKMDERLYRPRILTGLFKKRG